MSTGTILLDQIQEHLREQVRPRLEGLTDEEYLWDPTEDGDVWTVHLRGRAIGGTEPAPGQNAPHEPAGFEDVIPGRAFAGGAGAWVVDFADPAPEPPPVTTIAWRLAHVIVGVLAARSHSHHGGPAADYMTWEYAGTASEALAQLDRECTRWLDGVGRWSEEDLAQPCGAAEGAFAERSRADLVAHINRELIHHLAEVCLLRDLAAHRG